MAKLAQSKKLKSAKALPKKGKIDLKSDQFSAVFREGSLLLLAAAAFYLFVSLISYSAQDPGPFQTSGQASIENWGGAVGAWLADFMFNMFGKTAYLVIVLMVVATWRVIEGKNEKKELSVSRILLPVIGFVFAMAGATALDSLYFENPRSLPYVSGGVLGDLTTASLLPKFGIVGTTLATLGMLLSGITLVTRLSWFNLMEWLGKHGFAVLAFVQSKFAAASDSLKGMQERKRRTESVSTLREKISAKTPPKIEPKAQAPIVSQRVEKERQIPLFKSDTGQILPPLSLLDPIQKEEHGYSTQELEMMSALLIKKLKDFNIDITVESIQPGPVITRFEIELAPGIKAATVVGLARDLARALSVVSIRVVQNIPGKPYMGIEIPNQTREIVYLLDSLSSEAYEKANGPLPIVLGKDIAGGSIVTDISKAPHLLVAGTTGSGKSVCINTLIMSLVYKRTPEEVRMIMVDPKLLELSVYEDIPHLLTPVVTDMKKAANALHWCIGEMDRRFKMLAAVGVRNLASYNSKVGAAIKKGAPIEDPLFEIDPAMPELPIPTLEKLPYIVVIVDELADLMMITKKKIEEVIIRIAQRARAAGIHLVLATQRPSVDVVTGLMKANVPSRIAFQVSSRADSRVILDEMGAEQLLGQGDMLFMPPGTAIPIRVHGAFVSDEEVKRIADNLRQMAKPVYIDEITQGAASDFAGGDGNGANGEGEEADELYDRAVFFVTKERKASISAVQRYLRVGYNRAARMIESMENSGIVGPLEHGKREILAPPPPELD